MSPGPGADERRDRVRRRHDRIAGEVEADPIGPRGGLALVCAYLDDRPIYLFDEWAADQDPNFKRVFYTELLPELKARGKTVIVITHDDAYFDVADRVVRLEDGRLREPHLPLGTPDAAASRATNETECISLRG